MNDNTWLDDIDDIVEELFENGILTGLAKNPLSAQESKLQAKQAILTHIAEQVRLGKVGLLEQFAEYCHEHYLGCGKNTLAPDGFEYSYNNEIINLIDPFVESLTESVK